MCRSFPISESLKVYFTRVRIGMVVFILSERFMMMLILVLNALVYFILLLDHTDVRKKRQ